TGFNDISSHTPQIRDHHKTLTSVDATTPNKPTASLIDVKSFQDSRLFPDFVDDLRSVPVTDLIPRGYGPHPEATAYSEHLVDQAGA
ncbi:hypothetical protein ACFOSH_40765, partial [Amycolatopsis speibonae]